MPIYSFVCKEGHFEDRLEKDPYRTLKCSCGLEAEYRPTMPHLATMRMGIDPQGCPTAADKWAKAHEKEGKETL